METSLTGQDLQEIYRLHTEERLSSVAIGKKFHRDHSTILYHLRKIRITGVIYCPKTKSYEVASPLYPRKSGGGTYKYQELLEEPRNQGLSYKQYTAIAKRQDPFNYALTTRQRLALQTEFRATWKDD